LSKDTNLLFW